MKRFFNLLLHGLICLTWLSLSTPLIASDNAGAFLQTGIGAAPSGTGLAYVAETRDAQALYWNPAALPLLDTFSASLFSTHLFETDYLAVQFATQTPVGPWGFGYTSAKLSQAIETTRSGGRASETGNLLDYSAQAFFIGTGFKLSPSLSFGLTGKLIQESIASRNASGVGLDAALLFQPSSQLSLGLNAQNIIPAQLTWNTPSANTDSIPLNLKAGLSWQPITPLTLLLDCDFPLNRPSILHYGLAYRIADPLVIRAGFSQSLFSFGTGLILNPFLIDFSSEFQNDLDTVYKVSLGIQI